MLAFEEWCSRYVTVIFLKNKGGVGSSHAAMAVATLLRQAANGDYTSVLCDLDGSTGTCVNRLGERNEDGTLSEDQTFDGGVPAFDMLKPAERAKLFEIVEVHAKYIILDAPATSIDTFKQLSENLVASDWVEHNRTCGRSLVVMIPITPNLSSIIDVPAAIDLFGPDAHYVAVRSMRGCRDEDYMLWHENDFKDKFGRIVSGRSKARLEEVQGSVIDMPALNSGVLARIEALKITFAEAMVSDLLHSYERITVTKWLKALAIELEKIRGPLGLYDDFKWNFK